MQLELLGATATLVPIMACPPFFFSFFFGGTMYYAYLLNKLYLPILTSGLQFFGASETRTKWPS